MAEPSTFPYIDQAFNESIDYDFTPNCSRQGFSPVQGIFRVYLLPIVSLFGVIANLINLRIFASSKMRCQPVNWFFFALSLSDFVVLITSFLVIQLPLYAERWGNLAFYNMAQTIIVDFYPLARTSHTCSVVLTVVVSVHRYLGVVHPFLIRRISNVSVIRITIAVAIFFSFLVNAKKWLELNISYCKSEVFIGEFEQEVSPSEYMSDNTYHLIDTIIHTVIIFVLPFTILTFVNYKIVFTLRNSHRLRRQMTTSRSTKKSSNVANEKCKMEKLYKKHLSLTPEKEVFLNNGAITPPSGVEKSSPSATVAACKKENSQGISVMLLAITCQFLSFNLLAFIHNVIELIADEAQNVSYAETILTEVSTFLVNLNCATTILIYLKFGSKYRIVFTRMLKTCGIFNRNEKQQPITDMQSTQIISHISHTASIRTKLWPPSRSQSVHKSPPSLNTLCVPRQNRAMSAITFDPTINQFTDPIRV